MCWKSPYQDSTIVVHRVHIYMPTFICVHTILGMHMLTHTFILSLRFYKVLKNFLVLISI